MEGSFLWVYNNNMETDKFPKIEIMPIVDRVVSAALWVGRLVTKHHYDPSELNPLDIDINNQKPGIDSQLL